MDFKEGVGAMIEKYFNGVIEQVYHRIGNAEKEKLRMRLVKV